mmetsp:Transcript_10722/g.26943  ORF Transcript_10722/g.26943 Transcript_10722/m.26943 type:complete len:220 (+) Transcript_10722:1813-2472(+)
MKALPSGGSARPLRRFLQPASFSAQLMSKPSTRFRLPLSSLPLLRSIRARRGSIRSTEHTPLLISVKLRSKWRHSFAAPVSLLPSSAPPQSPSSASRLPPPPLARADSTMPRTSTGSSDLSMHRTFPSLRKVALASTRSAWCSIHPSWTLPLGPRTPTLLLLRRRRASVMPTKGWSSPLPSRHSFIWSYSPESSTVSGALSFRPKTRRETSEGKSPSSQ